MAIKIKKERVKEEEPQGLPVRRGQRPAPKFAFIHYPQAWRFSEEVGFVPSFSRLVSKHGVNGVPASGSLAKPIAVSQGMGGTYINPSDHRLGDEFMDYCGYYDCDNGQKWYVEWWQEATILSTGRILWNHSAAQEAKDGFAAHVRDSAIVEPMQYEYYLDFVRREERSFNQLAARADSNPSLLGQVKKAEKRLEAMKAAWSKDEKPVKGAKLQRKRG